MVTDETKKEYLSRGQILAPIPANTKRSYNTGWNTTKIEDDIIYRHDGNFLWSIGYGLLVVDIDTVENNSDEGEARFDHFMSVLLKYNKNINLTPTVRTRSGGYHIYLKRPKAYIDNDIHAKMGDLFPKIDFLAHKRGVGIPGNTFEGGEYSWFDEGRKFFLQDAPKELMELISRDDYSTQPTKVTDKNDRDPIEEVRRALSGIPADIEYNIWASAIGRACWCWDNGGEDGYKVWKEWSDKGRRPDQKQATRKLYNSFSEMKKHIGIGTLFHYSSEKAKIKQKDIPFDPLEGGLTEGTKEEDPPIRDFNPYNWVYVREQKKYFDLVDKMYVDSTAFNIEARREYEDQGKQAPASWLVTQNIVKTVQYDEWAPEKKSKIFKDDYGYYVANAFNPRFFPVPAKEKTEAGEKALKIIKDHFELICGNKEDATILIEWFAYIRQNPGERVNWCPVIVGEKGLGKSIIMEIGSIILGDKYTGKSSIDEIRSAFSEWAVGKLLVCIDEFHVAGQNRHEMMAKLKTFTADRRINVRRKHKDGATEKNRTNYIFATNHNDAIPLDVGERRFFVIKPPFCEISELENLTKLSEHEYFDRLVWAAFTPEHAPQIVRYFEEYPISPSFYKRKRAKITGAAKSMIALEESGMYGHSLFNEMIEAGGKYWNKDIIIRSKLEAALTKELNAISQMIAEDAGDEDSYNIGRGKLKMTQLLKKEGYCPSGKLNITIDGYRTKYWSKNGLTPEQAMKALEYSKEEEGRQVMINSQRKSHGYSNFKVKKDKTWGNIDADEEQKAWESQDVPPIF